MHLDKNEKLANRRSLIKLLPLVVIGGISGCTAYNSEEESPAEDNRDSRVKINEIKVYPHPSTAEEHETVDVTVNVNANGREVYNQEHTISDLSTMDGVVIEEEWMDISQEYVITVRTSIHDEPTVFTSEKYKEAAPRNRRENYDCLSLRFRITSFGTRSAPVPELCPTGSSQQ